MNSFKQDFTTRQYMVTPDYEYFHYNDKSTMEVDYHNHDFFEIYFFVSGKVTYFIEGKSYKLQSGDILLIHNKELHKPVIEPGIPYERIVIWVNPDFLDKQSRENANLSMCFESLLPNRYNLIRPNPETLALLKSTLAKFERACSSTGFGSNILKEIHMVELLVYLNKAYLEVLDAREHVDIEFNETIDDVIRFINDNLENDLSLDILSSRFYLSKYHLLREFKKYTGYTIHQYINRKRLILAKALLKEGNQVSNVCVRCGFGDYSNFIRSFKKSFGVSPKKYFRLHT